MRFIAIKPYDKKASGSVAYINADAILFVSTVVNTETGQLVECACKIGLVDYEFLAVGSPLEIVTLIDIATATEKS
jgi:hypothetical protein